MSIVLYNIFLLLFNAGIRIAALFNPKARKWVTGRKNSFEKIQAAVAGSDQIIWMHCASLGEFEQGRPLLESLKLKYPQYKLLLTFFSPSGYEVRKEYKGADWVFYLPMDGPRNAKRFLEIVNPSLVIFVKYEFWFYYLKKIKYRNIPLLLVSALFWEKMSFFKWYGAMQRKMLSRFDHLFVQNEESKRLIDAIGLQQITSVSGDTRFDRVIDIAETAAPVAVVAAFTGTAKTIVAGSTWPDDEQVLQQTLSACTDTSLQLIIAPHEINDKHLEEIKKLFPEAILYSQLSLHPALAANSRVLIIDNIGLLSRLYQYAFISYIGGGFGKGIHNTLEAAVYGKPVIFGPTHHKFKEATDLLQNGGAIRIASAAECIATVNRLLLQEAEYNERSAQAKNYVYSSRGATQKIIQFIQEKRLLTN